MSRARKTAGFRDVRDVQTILYPLVTKSALIRLERLQEAPTARPDRARAALCLLLYGYQLDDFAVSDDDLPPAIDREQIWELRAGASTRWFTPSPSAVLAVAA